MKALSLFFALPILALPLFAADIPRTWEKSAVETLEVPLVRPEFSPVHISEEAYYKIPERVIYKSYPVYAPGREPAGYMEHLRSLDPAIAFDASKLNTPQEWIAAGEIVFNAPTSFNPVFFTPQNLQDPEFVRKAGIPIAKDGTIPFASWVIRKKGTVELGSMGCATCHTRVMSDGTVIAGAQGNNPSDREGAMLLRASAQAMGPDRMLGQVRKFAMQFEAPWVENDLNRATEKMTVDEFIAAGEAIPPGVTARANTSMLLPPQIPDLIGVSERKFLDHTGFIRQRSIADLMRYSTLAQDMFTADRYGASAPASAAMPAVRYSDAELYALASYLYSLKPPANPNPFDASARRGQQLFVRETCVNCHTPPLYTNNKLVPADGFEAAASDEVVGRHIGVDPRYALDSRKGTGFYKVPSLKGLWYRGPLGHTGAAMTLEEWLDPERLNPDYIPAGFKGYDGKARSIPGHPFGLKLTPAEKKDLIAFLRTL
ncbi:MAG TPA: di-heme oxidoredictase family protein [Bryobacteraceae bacterium]|nr:di-heme oxidoredictase family protein [Bryobacteraceae bacterium]